MIIQSYLCTPQENLNIFSKCTEFYQIQGILASLSHLLTNMDKYLYICTSPLLNTYKIGFHNGSAYALFKRYQTALGDQVEFVMFHTPKPEEHEKILHRILQPYRENNEHFRKEEGGIFYVYCYMAKCVTGCEKVVLYSRRKYGYMREKAKWQYEKSERDDEMHLNNIIHNIEKTANITLSIPEDGIISALNMMNVSDNVVHDHDREQQDCEMDDVMDDVDREREQRMIDNPFSRFVFRGRIQ